MPTVAADVAIAANAASIDFRGLIEFSIPIVGGFSRDGERMVSGVAAVPGA
jgi:hypothetical protein